MSDEPDNAEPASIVGVTTCCDVESAVWLVIMKFVSMVELLRTSCGVWLTGTCTRLQVPVVQPSENWRNSH
jgi:hypothetical protein